MISIKDKKFTAWELNMMHKVGEINRMSMNGETAFIRETAKKAMNMLSKAEGNLEDIYAWCIEVQNGSTRMRPKKRYASKNEEDYLEAIEKNERYWGWSIYSRSTNAGDGINFLTLCQYEECDNKFLSPTRHKKFCSSKCRQANNYAKKSEQETIRQEYTVQCAGNSCKARIFVLREGHRFCSQKCRNSVKTRFKEALDSVRCESCGDSFKPRTSRARFCSDKCRVRAWDRKQALTTKTRKQT